jgi:hypothetical protein
MKMNKIVSWLSPSLLGMLCLLLNAAPVQALLYQTWVSAGGSDANACDRAAPCSSFNGAISKTVAGGTVSCLDPNNFFEVTITKSITIDCSATFAGVLASIPFTINALATDTVILRGLDILGAVRKQVSQ